MWLLLTKPKLSSHSHPRVVLGTLLAFCFPGCHSTIPVFLTSKMRENGSELLFLLPFTRSAAFVFLAASFNPASPVISEFSVCWEEKGKKEGWFGPLYLLFWPPCCPWAVKENFWQAMSGVTADLVGLNGDVEQQHFILGPFFLSRLCVGPHLPQGPVLTENHVCVFVCAYAKQTQRSHLLSSDVTVFSPTSHIHFTCSAPSQ